MSGQGTLRVFGAPSRYVQGPGALDSLCDLARPFGTRPLVIGDGPVMGMLGSRLVSLFDVDGFDARFGTLTGEMTRQTIAALADGDAARSSDMVIGVGGGKSLDAAKGVAVLLDLPVFTVPTIASNDSPTSAAIAVYDNHHVMVAVDRMARNPEVVVVDTDLIASAPVRFLRAGIGDAISKKFEAEACLAGTGVTPFGTRPLSTAIAIADCCYRTILAHGEAGVAACEANQPTADLEAVVEATILMSGLGFENGGLSLAHSLTRGLVKARGAKNAIHGDHIAWSLLVHLAAEERDDAMLLELIDFYRRIGLPARLAELGMDEPTDTDIDQIADLTMTAPHLRNFAKPLNRDLVARAIRRVEALVDAP